MGPIARPSGFSPRAFWAYSPPAGRLDAGRTLRYFPRLPRLHGRRVGRMTRRALLSLLPGLLAAGGCWWSKTTTTPRKPWYDPFEVFGSSPDAVVVMTALIDRPGGDPYLTDGLWPAADKPIPHETAALLAENGIRVGIISGIPPAEFSALITSDKATTARRLNLRRLNEPKVLPVIGPVEALEYAVLP